ncbi:MAG: hypothetical protein KKF46_02645 [Nanoarchaeota archaeon]|nr:hypothetical protein [Nanoarchaeota archaeon]MBU1321230.1 hypothetical protein [Nanoarchaeota archaeon]MBU1597035.1 hypothetical protein [Nanoarchaeota archaeon]MBU2441819.1 hypothetical protein [Nanoarchaeota archaeon]
MKKKRGRPIGSSIRQNLIEILFFKGKAYGYELYKDYVALFPKVTLRVIYYHLKKGVALGEFKLETIKMEKGDYSWGGEAEKKYYALGTGAKPKIEARVKAYFEGKKRGK